MLYIAQKNFMFSWLFWRKRIDGHLRRLSFHFTINEDIAWAQHEGESKFIAISSCWGRQVHERGGDQREVSDRGRQGQHREDRDWGQQPADRQVQLLSCQLSAQLLSCKISCLLTDKCKYLAAQLSVNGLFIPSCVSIIWCPVWSFVFTVLYFAIHLFVQMAVLLLWIVSHFDSEGANHCILYHMITSILHIRNTISIAKVSEATKCLLWSCKSLLKQQTLYEKNWRKIIVSVSIGEYFDR